MHDTELWIVLLGCMVAMVATVAAVVFFDRRRTRAMDAAGRRLHLEPLARGEPLRAAPVELLRKKGGGIGVALEGTWQGRPILLFDLFHPAVDAVSMQTVLMVRMEGWRVPEFAAVKRSISHFRPTVDLPRAMDAPPGLSERFWLYSNDGHWPFGDGLTRWLCDSARRRGWLSSGWSVEGVGDALYVYRRACKANPSRLREWLDEALAEAVGFAGHISATTPASATLARPGPTRGRVIPFRKSFTCKVRL